MKIKSSLKLSRSEKNLFAPKEEKVHKEKVDDKLQDFKKFASVKKKQKNKTPTRDATLPVSGEVTTIEEESTRPLNFKRKSTTPKPLLKPESELESKPKLESKKSKLKFFKSTSQSKLPISPAEKREKSGSSKLNISRKSTRRKSSRNLRPIYSISETADPTKIIDPTKIMDEVSVKVKEKLKDGVKKDVSMKMVDENLEALREKFKDASDMVNQAKAMVDRAKDASRDMVDQYAATDMVAQANDAATGLVAQAKDVYNTFFRSDGDVQNVIDFWRAREADSAFQQGLVDAFVNACKTAGNEDTLLKGIEDVFDYIFNSVHVLSSESLEVLRKVAQIKKENPAITASMSSVFCLRFLMDTVMEVFTAACAHRLQIPKEFAAMTQILDKLMKFANDPTLPLFDKLGVLRTRLTTFMNTLLGDLSDTDALGWH